jgi:dTDP-4-amino-4,6-dideoxygalactose transaminase
MGQVASGQEGDLPAPQSLLPTSQGTLPSHTRRVSTAPGVVLTPPNSWRAHELERRVPFNRPLLAGREFEYMSAAIAAGHISGDGQFTSRCNEILRRLIGSHEAFLTTSCTHALELAALLLRIEPGDEVIVPSFTFVSTVNAFALRGAKLVFADIRPDTLNIDEDEVACRITKNTKAVVVVHYGGIAAEMDVLTNLASSGGCALIEDNAHGLFGSYRNQPLGSFGAMSTLSFHETKNVHCGEGGALMVNDPSLKLSAEVIREKGTNRSDFFRGVVKKYTWVDVGSSYLPSDLLAAFLCAQLEEAQELQRRRKLLWDRYYDALTWWSEKRGVKLPSVPPDCDHPAHLFYLLLRDTNDRQRFIEHLDRQNVHAVFHYIPLHNSPQGAKLGGMDYSCPVTEDVSSRLVRLPLYPGLTDAEQSRVIEAVISFR